MSDREGVMRQLLTEALSPTELTVIDDSHKHAGHASARGGGHFTVHLVSDAFRGKSLIERHRMVYQALEAMMQSEIHALSIKAETLEEANY